MAFSKVAMSASLHFAKISLHFPKCRERDRFGGATLIGEADAAQADFVASSVIRCGRCGIDWIASPSRDPRLTAAKMSRP